MWIGTSEQTTAVAGMDVSATKPSDQEEGGEAFFGHCALEALLQLGDLTAMGIMSKFFLVFWDYLENLIPKVGVFQNLLWAK